MESIVFNRESGQVTGIYRQAFAFEREIKLPFPITLQKTVPVDTGLKRQATNESGQLVYATDLTLDEEGKLLSYTETTESEIPVEFEYQTQVYKVQTGTTTESQEVTVEEQTGTKIVTEVIDNGDGTTTEVSKEVPVYEMVTKTVEVEVPVYTEQSVEAKVPTKFKSLLPVAEAVIEQKNYDLETDFTQFNASEVVQAKIQGINANNLRKVAYFSEDLNLEEFDSANAVGTNFGNGFLALEPSGETVTQAITLPKETDALEFYIEAQDGVVAEIGIDTSNFLSIEDSGVTLPYPASEVYVRFSNPKDTRRELYAFGILA